MKRCLHVDNVHAWVCVLSLHVSCVCALWAAWEFGLRACGQSHGEARLHSSPCTPTSVSTVLCQQEDEGRRQSEVLPFQLCSN